ncbi:MAG TPA: phosphatidate cytidylyltransferase [Micromonospora sp.]
MSHPDPYGDERDVHRARQAGAAPDPYSAPRPPDSSGAHPAAGMEIYPHDPMDSAYRVMSAVEMDTSVEPAPDVAPTVASPAEEPATRSRRGGGHRRRRRGDGSNREPRAPGRAGRNLPAAIGIGVALIALILAALFLWPPAFFAVVAGAALVGTWELARAVRSQELHPPLPPLFGGSLLIVALAWWAGANGLVFGLVMTVLAILVWRLGDGPDRYQRDVGAATLIAVYVPFLLSFAALLVNAPDGEWRIVVTLAAVVLSDTGGYAVGVFFGKHPMAPRISPKKSWEGLAGSLVSSALGSALLVWLLLDVAPWWGALFGLGVSGAAVLGDLAESMIKRDLGVKDMSNLLPGHGGLMDRLDSILFAVPTSYLLLSVLAPAA